MFFWPIVVLICAIDKLSLSEAKTVRGGCFTRKCLLDSGCGLFYDVDPMYSDPVSLSKCLNGKNDFEEFRLCYQTTTKNKIGDRIGSLILETKMKHGFRLDSWMVEHSDHQQHNHAFYDGLTAPYLVIQYCYGFENNITDKTNRKKKDEEKEEMTDCYFSLRPGGGLSQVHYPLLGVMVATWKQRLHENLISKEVLSAFLKFRSDGLEVKRGIDRGSREYFSNRYVLHEYLHATSQEFRVGVKYEPVVSAKDWVEVVHYYEIDENNRGGDFSESKSNLTISDLEDYGKRVTHTVKLENPSHGPQIVDVRDFEIYVCPISHYDVTSKRNQKPADLTLQYTTSGHSTHIKCPKFNLGTTCLCHPISKNNFTTYKKICVSNSRVGKYLEQGNMKIGEPINSTMLLNCDCNLQNYTHIDPKIRVIKTNTSDLNTLVPINTTATVTITNGTNQTKNTDLISNHTQRGEYVKSSSSNLMLFCRDFKREHPDMFYVYSKNVEEGVVKDDINPNTRKPVWNPPEVKWKSFTTKRNFETWFISGPDTIVAQRLNLSAFFNNSESTFTYGGPSFFPFDFVGTIEGKEAKNIVLHNYYFTCESHTRVNIGMGGKNNRHISLTSDGDVWFFLNGKLLLDLGGTHELTTKKISLDILELKDNENYKLDLFYANRFPPNSTFIMTLEQGIYLNCKPEDYDRCGVCDGDGTSCSSNNTLYHENVEITMCDESNPDDPCWNSKYKNTIEGPLKSQSRSQTSFNCGVNNLRDGIYEFKFDFIIERPYIEPNLLLITASKLHGNLRELGTCDSIHTWTNLKTVKWDDIDLLWDPIRNDKLPEVLVYGWNKTVVESVFPKSEKPATFITYNFKISLRNLLECTKYGSKEFTLTVDETSGSNVYLGTWYLSRIIPEDTNREYSGIHILDQLSCSFSLIYNPTNDNIESHQEQESQIILSEDHIGMNSLTQYTQDPLLEDIILSTSWLETYCSSPEDPNNSFVNSDVVSVKKMDLGLAIMLKTCVKVVKSNWWSKLSETPKVYLMNEIDPNSSTESNNFLLQSLGSFGGKECNIQNSERGEWNCCQKWLLYGPGLTRAPFEGTLKIFWRAEVHKLNYGYTQQQQQQQENSQATLQNGDGKMPLKSALKIFQIVSELKLSINQKCSTLKTIYCNSTSDSCNSGQGVKSLPKVVSLVSTSILFVDDDFSEIWNPRVHGPLPEGSRIYGTLKPQLTENFCSNHKAVILEIWSKVYYRDIYNGKVESEPCETILEYMMGNSELNDHLESWVSLSPETGPCYMNFSWVVKKKECPFGYVPPSLLRRDTKSKSTNAQTSSQRKTDDYLRVQWDIAEGKWIVGDTELNLLDLKRKEFETYSFDKNEKEVKWSSSKTILFIKWKLVPHTSKWKSSAPKNSILKRQSSSNNSSSSGGHVLSDNDFPMDYSTEIETRCPHSHDWDVEDGSCNPKNFVWLSSTDDTASVWILTAFLIFLVIMIPACVCYHSVDRKIRLYKKKVKSKQHKKSSVRAYYWMPIWESFVSWLTGDSKRKDRVKTVDNNDHSYHVPNRDSHSYEYGNIDTYHNMSNESLEMRKRGRINESLSQRYEQFVPQWF